MNPSIKFILEQWKVIGGILSLIVVATTFFIRTQEVISDYPKLKLKVDSLNSNNLRQSNDILNLYYYKYPYNSYIHN